MSSDKMYGQVFMKISDGLGRGERIEPVKLYDS